MYLSIYIYLCIDIFIHLTDYLSIYLTLSQHSYIHTPFFLSIYLLFSTTIDGELALMDVSQISGICIITLIAFLSPVLVALIRQAVNAIQVMREGLEGKVGGR